MYTPPSQSISTELKVVGAKSLFQDPVLSDRFANLMLGVKHGLKTGKTALTPIESTNLSPNEKDLRENIVKDITHLEKGIQSIAKLTDKSAKKSVELEKNDDIGPMLGVFAEFQKLSTTYLLASTYAHKKAVSTSEEIQIFSRGK